MVTVKGSRACTFGIHLEIWKGPETWFTLPRGALPYLRIQGKALLSIWQDTLVLGTVEDQLFEEFQ